MTKRRLLLPVISVVTLLAVANALMGLWSHRLPYYRMLEKIRTAHDPNLLIVGNSLLTGLDEPALVRAANEGGESFNPINVATVASQPPEHKLLFNYAYKRQPSIRTLVVGIYDFQLTTLVKSRMTDLMGNRMIAVDHRFGFDEVVSSYGFGAGDQVELGVARTLPMVANRGNVWKYVELVRRSMAAMGMPRVATNNMGRVDDFKAIESASPETFDAEANAFLEQPDHFNPSYDSIFSTAARAKMNIVVVIMPMSPYHRAIFYSRPSWKGYIAALDQLADRRGIRVIDASGWLPAEGNFKDHLHMNSEALHEFSLRLGSELSHTFSR